MQLRAGGVDPDPMPTVRRHRSAAAPHINDRAVAAYVLRNPRVRIEAMGITRSREDLLGDAGVAVVEGLYISVPSVGTPIRSHPAHSKGDKDAARATNVT